MRKIIRVAVLSLCFLLFSGGCNLKVDEIPEIYPETYSVSFYNYDGSLIQKVDVEQNKEVVYPNAEKESDRYNIYNFDKWVFEDQSDASLALKSVGADMVYALPGAAISVLSPEASVAFVWNDRVGECSREELEAEWKEKCASAAEAADCGEIDDIVEPAELRARICASLSMLASKAEGTPTRRHANMPL